MTIFNYPLIVIVRTYNGARQYRGIISPGIICGSKLMNIFHRVQFPDFNGQYWEFDTKLVYQKLRYETRFSLERLEFTHWNDTPSTMVDTWYNCNSVTNFPSIICLILIVCDINNLFNYSNFFIFKILRYISKIYYKLEIFFFTL